MTDLSYSARRSARSVFAQVRGLRYHLLVWGDPAQASAQRPPLWMLHGWMDVGASFQFVVDALPGDRCVIALDWRGFGLSESAHADTYWFADYLGDLDTLLDAPELGLPAEHIGRPVDLLGHSMGANVAMMYAGIRPLRVRRLVSLEGFGLPQTRPEQAPAHYAQWLDELRQPTALHSYADLADVARRLRRNNPLLPEDKATWLAAHWSRRNDRIDGDGRWHLLADALHKRISPVPYRAEEILACWQCITAPMLWVEGDHTDIPGRWGNRYPRAEFEARLAQVANVERQTLSPAGHMLHHDQPEALARCLDAFLSR